MYVYTYIYIYMYMNLATSMVTFYLFIQTYTYACI